MTPTQAVAALARVDGLCPKAVAAAALQVGLDLLYGEKAIRMMKKKPKPRMKYNTSPRDQFFAVLNMQDTVNS